MFLNSVHYFYVKIRDLTLEWSPSLPPKMPRCLDLVNKLCSISNSSIHWKLTLSYWCHAVINYGDPDVIDNSLRNCVSYYLCYILTWKVHLNFGPSKTHVCTESAIFVDTCFIYWHCMLVESNFAQSCKIRRNRPNNCFLGSFVTFQLRSKEIDTYITLVKNLSFTTSSSRPM